VATPPSCSAAIRTRSRRQHPAGPRSQQRPPARRTISEAWDTADFVGDEADDYRGSLDTDLACRLRIASQAWAHRGAASQPSNDPPPGGA
jgi:hypothetical protein